MVCLAVVPKLYPVAGWLSFGPVLDSDNLQLRGLAIHRGPIPETRCFRSRHMSLCTEMPLPLGWSLVPNLGRCVPNRQLSLHRWIANALLPPCLGSPSSVFGRRLVCMIAELVSERHESPVLVGGRLTASRMDLSSGLRGWLEAIPRRLSP